MPGNADAEITSQDAGATFKLRVNLVEVHEVVRDSEGAQMAARNETVDIPY